MLKWIFISIGFLLIASLAAVYFHVSNQSIQPRQKFRLQYRNKHAKNPLDELKKGLGNGTIDKEQYFDVQGSLTLHKADMERQGKFFNSDGTYELTILTSNKGTSKSLLFRSKLQANQNEKRTVVPVDQSANLTNFDQEVQYREHDVVVRFSVSSTVLKLKNFVISN